MACVGRGCPAPAGAALDETVRYEDKHMRESPLSRRELLGGAGAAIGLSAVGAGAPARREAPRRFSYCLNTSTIRGQKLGIVRELEVAAEAGYDSIEPWVGDINRYVRAGHSAGELRKRIEDLGLTLESAISFPRWIVNDEAMRAEAFEQVRREMDLLARIGGKRMAAPPAGATREPGLDLDRAAERYRALLEMGEQFGIVPQIEIWGPSKNLHRLGQAMYIVIESGHPAACLLPDIYHTYKGGSDFHGFKAISGRTIQVLHINDYPADPPRETINDSHRVFPGDGIAPVTQVLRDLAGNGCNAVLSLELFNPTYWKQDPLVVAKMGLAKVKAAVRKALGAA